MRKTVGYCMAVLGMTLLGGCTYFSQENPTAEYPNAVQFPQLYQANLRAAAHWELIAENEAKMLSSKFAGGTQLAFDVDPIFASPPYADFAISYHHMLTEDLLDGGMVMHDTQGPYRLSYHIQVVEHAPRAQWNPFPGFYSTVSAAGFFIANAVNNWTEPSLALIPFAVAADFYNHANKDSDRTPNTELVLTTAVRDGDQILYSNTSVYYMRARDRGLYQGGRYYKVAAPMGG